MSIFQEQFMSTTVPSGASHKQSKTQVMTGADIVVHSLVEHGVEVYEKVS